MWMKTYTAIFMMLLSFMVQAAPVFSSGSIKFTGDTYISTLSDTETKGIGRVTTITQGDTILWSTGDSGNYINFVFGEFAPVVSPTAPIFNFLASGGYVDFYLNTVGTFNTLLDVSTAISNISSGNLLLSTTASGGTIGIATNNTYSANGFLDVQGGLFSWLLNTNTRETFVPGVFSDLSFGLVGSKNQSNLVSSDYAYIASSDLQGSTSISQVPLPAAVWTMLAGLIGMTFVNKKRSV